MSTSEGRIARSWRLLGTSWRLLRDRPSLFFYPGLASVSVTVGSIAIFCPVLIETADDSSLTLVLIAMAAAAVPATVLTTFCNVAFLTMVQAHLADETPTIRDGFRGARSRLPVIVKWSLLAALIGGVLRALPHLPGGAWIGSLVSLLGGLAWTLATYFVLPIFVIEDVGVRDGLRRSVEVFKKRWGESISGEITVGVILGLLTIPGILIIGAAFIVSAESEPAAVVLLIAGLTWITPLLVFSSALTEMFQLVLYRETIDGVVPAPFNGTETHAAFLQRPESMITKWRRGRSG